MMQAKKCFFYFIIDHTSRLYKRMGVVTLREMDERVYAAQQSGINLIGSPIQETVKGSNEDTARDRATRRSDEYENQLRSEGYQSDESLNVPHIK